MSNLFAVIDIEEEQKKPSNNWLTIGSSYDDGNRKKKESQPEPAQTTSKEDKNYFNVGQRKTAAELISSDESDDSEEERKRLKKKKKKQKKKKAQKKLEIDDLDKMISEDDEDLNQALDLYVPKATPLNHDTAFLYKYQVKKGLCEVSILRFGEKGLYTYGFPQMKDVPLFRRMRYNLILGLKSDRMTLELIDELNKIQGINQSIYQGTDNTVPLRRYYNTAIPKNEIVQLKRASEPNNLLLKQDFIAFEESKDGMEEDDGEFRFNRDEMSEKEANLLDKTREYNKKLDENPKDPLLWIDFVNFQDKFHQGMIGKSASQSLVEKKLAILERAQSEKNKLGNHPLLILYHLRLLDQSNKNDDFYRVLLQTWEKYLNQNQTNVVFWILFTDFRYSNFAKFSITYMRESLNGTLNQIQMKITSSSNTKEIAIFKDLQLYLIKKLCYFEKMAGFYERATGIFQSLVELNLFQSESVQKVYEKTARLAKFQEYYEQYELPKTGELLVHTGWPDCEKKLGEVQKEFKSDFIGIFEEKVISEKTNPSQNFDKFVEQIRYYIPEDLEKTNVNALVEWMSGEVTTMNYWRPANTEFDKERIAESADSIVLFEDIQNYLYTVHQESFKMEVIDTLFELLDLPPIFSGVFQRTSYTSTNYLYSTKLQRDLEKAFNDTLDINNETFQICGIETHELFLKYPHSSYIAAAIEKSPLFVSRLEYARRTLYHMNNLVPDCNNVLSYILYIESLYSQISSGFSLEEIKKSEKRIEDLLKKYQKNYYLYIMYTEHVLLKQGKIERAKKVFENLLKFVTKKKDVFMVYYFYINMFVRKDMNSLNKAHQPEIIKLLWRFTCHLQGSKYTEGGDISPMQIIQIQKTINKFMSEALLKPLTSKPKRIRLYFMTKICPLSKAAMLIYFSFVCSSVLTMQDVEGTMKEYRDNMNVLNLKIAEKLQKNVEGERVVFIKKNNQGLIDLMNFAVYRLLIYRKHSSTYVNPQALKRFAIENTKMNPKNMTLAIETIKAIYMTSLRTNQLFKLKTNLDLKVIETPYWYIVISEELRRYSADEKEKLMNLLKSYFQEFNKEETLYDQLFSEMEKRYRKKEIPDWEDCSYLQENYLYINDQFGKLYLKFISLFFPQDLKREALISLHRFPFSKDKYLSYLTPSLSDETEIKKIFTMLFEKEIRTYKEYNV